MLDTLGVQGEIDMVPVPESASFSNANRQEMTNRNLGHRKSRNSCRDGGRAERASFQPGKDSEECLLNTVL